MKAKKYNLLGVLLIALTVSLVVVSSCKKDDSSSLPDGLTLSFPENGALYISANSQLIWNAIHTNSPITYDVYLSRDLSSLALVSEGVVGTSYTMNLNRNGTYFWKVVAKDQSGWMVESPIWTFTTDLSENVSLLSPENEATDVALGSWLKWEAIPDDRQISYDVYFGNDASSLNLVSQNDFETSYKPDLRYNRSYFWKVVATDGDGVEYESPIWSFSTANDNRIGNWIKLGDFGGIKRTSATGTTVDGLGYIGLGYNYTKDERLTDFWTYNASTKTWDQIADFPGSGRTNAVSFEANGKLYVGTGFDGTSGVRLRDFYEYNPADDSWKQIDDLQSDNLNSPDVLGREGMTAFSINGIGYVLGGSDADGIVYRDMYAYDPAVGSWSKRADFPGFKRSDAVAFVIDDYAYVCTGISNGSYPGDFYKYDPATDSWTELRRIYDYSDDSYDDSYDIIRTNAVAFTCGGKGYIATGGKGSSSKDVWEYNPATDLWIEKTPFEGAARYNAVAFTINDIGYVLTGQQGAMYNFDDFYYFEPDSECNLND